VISGRRVLGEEETKNRGIAVCISCVYPECKIIGAGEKPKVKSEFISVLQPEIKRRISGLVVDATPGAIEEVIEETNHQSDSSDDSDCSEN